MLYQKLALHCARDISDVSSYLIKYTALMKTLLVFFVFISSALQAQTTYSTFMTKIECPLDKKEMAVNAHKQIESTLTAMTKEGFIVNFDVNMKEDADKVNLVYMIPSENEDRFKKISSDWKTRAAASDPKLFQTFWETCPTRKDTMVSKHKMMYPLIRSSNSGVVVVEGIDEKPDPTLDYKIVVDFVAFPQLKESKGKIDSSALNWALPEIGRIYNLHVAAGIPKDKIQIVAAVHANAMESFFTNEAYNEKYKIDNPNLPLVEELSNAGVKFLVCGQSLTWWGYKKEMLVPQAKLTLTAQTTLTSRQMDGFALKKLAND